MCGQGQAIVGSLPSGATASPLRILLVDDNVDVLDSFTVLLDMHGYQVLACSHPVDALEAAPSFEPDICILDIGLPCMSGHELARRLLAAGLSKAQYIAVTGYGAPEMREASKRAGFHLHLTKPVDPEYLLARIASTAQDALHRTASA